MSTHKTIDKIIDNSYLIPGNNIESEDLTVCPYYEGKILRAPSCSCPNKSCYLNNIKFDKERTVSFEAEEPTRVCIGLASKLPEDWSMTPEEFKKKLADIKEIKVITTNRPFYRTLNTDSL